MQCKPRQDERAEENLIRQGYECVRPKFRQERVLRGLLRARLESLFPGYLFIRMSDDSSWAPLRSTRGVSHVVSFGSKPLPVPSHLVNELQRRSGVNTTTNYKVGDDVRITTGNFAALDAIFMEMDGESRVILLVKLLNQEYKISVPIIDVAGL